MRDVGPGTVLGGRYALGRRLSQGRDLERWSAHDATLEREVALTIVGSEHPNRAGVLDAARRAAGVEDTRLVRILDVGTQQNNSFIVEEAMSGSESLAAILLQGPLPPEEARRVAGETAKGLQTAGQRGLHHLRLTPQYVMIAPDGSVRVSGVAVAAATEAPQEQEPDSATASRRDALCLVAVVYAALTSRWPLDELGSGVELAPRSVDGAVAPSEIAAGLPGDLDALCRMTLNESAGPLTPGDVADQIAPWPLERVQRDGIDPTVILRQPDLGDVAGEADDPAVTALIEIPHGIDVPTSSSRGGGPVGPPTRHLIQFEDVEPPLPLLPASTAQAPSRGQSKWVVLIVATFLLLALLVGYQGLIGLSTITDLFTSTPTPAAAKVTTPPSSVPTSAPTSAAPKVVAGPIAILSATGFDPQGDQSEKNEQAARVYDGNLATSWTSELYNTPQFGNLKKGVGLVLDLGQPTSVHQVTIDLGNGPVDVTAYAATSQSQQGATVIGTATAASGQVNLKAVSTIPRAQYVIVWFTNLAPDGGMFGASVAEIALS